MFQIQRGKLYTEHIIFLSPSYFKTLSLLFTCNKMEEKLELELPLVAFKKNTSWACANIIRLRVPTVSGDMSTVGSRFKADNTVSLICRKAPLAN